MNVLGLDIGAARIGVALGNTETRLASPVAVVPARPEEQAFAELAKLIRAEGVRSVIIGMPRLLSHPEHETEQQAQIQAWAQRFTTRISVPIVFADETLSSALAGRWQQERQEKGKRDDLAALAILQSYLDRL